MTRHLCFFVLVMASGVFFASPRESGAVLVTAKTGGASAATKNVSDTFTVNLELQSWNVADSADSIQFDVVFDPTIFSFNSGSAFTSGANTFITLAGSGGPIVDTSNAQIGKWVFTVTDTAFDGIGSGPTFGTDADGIMDLGSLSLTAIAPTIPGTSTISLSNFSYLGVFGPLTPTGGTSVSNLVVTVVPEPSSFLFIGVIGAMVGTWQVVRRRRVSA